MELPAQVAQEVPDLRTLARVGIPPEIPSSDCDARNDQQPLQVEGQVQYRRLPRGAHIHTQCGRPLSLDSSTTTMVQPSATAVFRGHATRFQRRIATASGSRAWPVGRWEL